MTTHCTTCGQRLGPGERGLCGGCAEPRDGPHRDCDTPWTCVGCERDVCPRCEVSPGEAEGLCPECWWTGDAA